MQESIDDLTAPWWTNGCELARRMLALADELETEAADGRYTAGLIRQVIRCEYNPLPDQLPELGDPPTLRSALPPNSRSGRGVAAEPGS
jgi:hypothetical protein